jgi:hypothetical protein
MIKQIYSYHQTNETQQLIIKIHISTIFDNKSNNFCLAIQKVFKATFYFEFSFFLIFKTMRLLNKTK